MGGIGLKIPADTLNNKVLRAFIKEISSDGNMNTHSPSSIIGISHIRLLSKPLGRDERMPIEETGTLSFLIYAYEKATGDETWAAQYSDLWPGYTRYLSRTDYTQNTKSPQRMV
ncbi:hypothetical protein E4T39_05328 [Aureobasidium subglaciale]|nr:hypothetical protein E4T39_05328 [Aureobasidium subglaciale]